MTFPTFSVVIPHYNHGRFLRRAVDAIRAQSHRPLEIVIVDDASTDGSRRLLDEVAREPLLRVHHNDCNRGVGYTSNRGVALCRGDYVYIAGADDQVLPGFFASAMDMARAYPQAGIVYGKMARTDESGDVLDVFEVSRWPTARFAAPPEFLAGHLESEDPSHSLCGATVYRRDALLSLGGYRAELGHWMDTFVARAIGLRHGACYVPEVFMNWRWSRQGFCGGTHWADQVRVVRRAAELMRDQPFCQWFPSRYVASWENASLDNLFRARVAERWPLLGRWRSQGGWRPRVACRAIKVLARLGRLFPRLSGHRPMART